MILTPYVYTYAIYVGRGAQGAVHHHDESQDQTAVWPHAARYTEETRNNQ